MGPFEHHSNILPWREREGIELIQIGQTKCGQFNYRELETMLKQAENDPRPKVGAFSKASNITGIITDSDRVSTLMHKYGGIVFWDYASAAPHVDIDVSRPGLAYKDAIFISTHKFIGGPDTPGILIARKDSVFRNSVPDKVGGGSIMYVSRSKHRYLDDIEAKEESGTPQIVGSIRAGLVFKVKKELGIGYIREREELWTQKTLKRLEKISCIKLLGSAHLDRLPIFSFLVLHKESGLYFHHHFINQLLNDLFGIQCRSGCACAGPYAIELLGMDDQKEAMFLNAFDNDVSRIGSLKPGFVRFNIPFFHSNDVIEFILDAVEFVCVNALYFTPLYELDQETGCWTNFTLKRSALPNEVTQYKHLSLFKMNDYKKGEVSLKNQNSSCIDRGETMETAEKILNAIVRGKLEYPAKLFVEHTEMTSAQQLTWFMTQREALKWLPNFKEFSAERKPKNPVFEVRKYPKPSQMELKNGPSSSSKYSNDSVTQILMERNNKALKESRGKNRRYTNLLSRQFQSPRMLPVLQPAALNPNNQVFKNWISQETTKENTSGQNKNTFTININLRAINGLKGNHEPWWSQK